MKTNSSILILVLLGVLFVAFAGCIQNAPNTGGDLTPTVSTPATPSEIAQDLSGATGTGADDITTEDLDDLESDLDALDAEVDDASQSDI